MNEWIIDAGDSDFEAQVLDRSVDVPMVLDFWAPWCGPCRTLGPMLERLALEHGGAFVVAKINVDENPVLAESFHVQSIPMLLGLRDRHIVAKAVGALPEADLRRFLTQVLPTEAESLAAAAAVLRTQGDEAGAEAMLRRAVEVDPRCDAALYGLAEQLADRGESGPALALIGRILPGPWADRGERLAAEIRLHASASEDESELRQKVEASPDDLAARQALGEFLAGAGRYAEALEVLVESVRRDRSFREGAARKAMLDVFEVLGPGHTLVDTYRSALARILFS